MIKEKNKDPLLKVIILIADSIGRYSVPASKGGAVQGLVEHLVSLNNSKSMMDMTVVTYYDEKAFELSKSYSNIKFLWIRVPKVIEFLDHLVFKAYRMVFPHKKSVSVKSIFSLIYYIIMSRRIIRKEKYDKYILENNIPSFMILKGLQKKVKGKYYFHLHNVPRVSAKCDDLIKDCKRILCVSNFVADQIQLEENAIGPIESERVRILYNCIDTNLFKKIEEDHPLLEDLRTQYGLSKEDKVVVFSGRLSYEKGADKVIEAVSKLENQNVVLLIVGSYLYGTSLKDSFYEQIESLSNKTSTRVIFTGYVEHEKMPYVYSLADVAVFPSIWDEPAGLTTIEAMACGVPVITTDAGGIKEYVGDAAIVYSRDENLVNNITNGIKEVFENSQLADRLSKEGRNRIRMHFTLNNYLEKFCALLEE